MCTWLLVVTHAEPAVIAVAIEVPHGPIVETLLERGFLVYAVNPKQLDRFRDRFTVAGVKDDRRDAHVLGDSLRTDRHCFRHLAAEDAVISAALFQRERGCVGGFTSGRPLERGRTGRTPSDAFCSESRQNNARYRAAYP
jgi:hypothetical protein